MKQKNKFPKTKKNITAFLNEEEGKISKKNIRKIGMGLFVAGMAAAGLMKADQSQANCVHSNHSSHSSHGSHGSHGSHSAHCSGGWCP
ncbi:MAG: hypothetical protein QMD77_00755 [Patescibacteria group bacterium]|nr:hypothetical protein [Patescibacteria group bacterium]